VPTQPPRKSTNDAPLPLSLESERSVLGAILLDNHALDDAMERLRPEDFFLDNHRRIYQEMMTLGLEDKPIDLVTITDRLHRSGELEAAGGTAYLAQLVDGVPQVSNVGHYARIVKEKSMLRAMIHTAHSIQQQAFEAGEDPGELLDRAESSFSQLSEDRAMEESAPRLLKDIIKSSTREIGRLYEDNAKILGMPTGYADLDLFTAGWMAEELVVLGARPSTGKSALMVEFALFQARQKNPVLILSLEMSRISLLFRMISNVGRINGHALRTGKCTAEMRRTISLAIEEIFELPILISDPPRMWVHEVVNRVRFVATRHGVKFAIIDYLQLVRAKAENRVVEVSKVSAGLKEAARIIGKRTGGTLLALAQLSRLAADEEPTLDKLRESGAIEQDADMVMFLWNQPVKEGEENRDFQQKNLTIAKQRNGPLGRVKFIFEGAFTSFRPAAKTIWDEPGNVVDFKKKGSGDE
jgi:replicative DNA helicase